MNHNHANYEQRLVFIHALLRDRFQLMEPATIETLAYEDDCPFKFNNFVYKVTLKPGTRINDTIELQPGCVTVPLGAAEFVLRLANSSAEGVNTFNRIENEVATISLVSRALNHVTPLVVPSIYAWGSASASGSQGWTMQQFMSGVPLDVELENMTIEQKREIFAQFATLLSAIQQMQLPDGVVGYGGLTFDPDGKIVSSRTVLSDAGPWSSLESYFAWTMRKALDDVEKNPYINGWRENGVRERVERFIESGISGQLQSVTHEDAKVVVHGDFTPNNMHYDPSSGRITALLDYDFATISHPAHEFIRSFRGTGGEFYGWSGPEDDDQLALRQAKLHGFPAILPKSTEEVDWASARTWDEELEKLHVHRPRTIGGIEQIANIEAIISGVEPWRLTNPDILARQSEEAKLVCKEKSETRLTEMLERLGF